MPSLFDDAFEDDRPPEPEPPEPAPRPAAAPPPWPPRRRAAKPPARTVYTVSELTAAVARRLEKEFFQVWLEGEISNARPAASGHLYFTLKDDAAQIKAVMFRGNLRLLRFKPADGQHVIARGQLEVYEARGEMQIVCQHLEPRGLGALQLAFEQLKRRLEAEGLFAAARKRPLPLLPRTIGIVTSLEGAAVRDIVRVVTNRHAGLRLLIRPCRVQGEGACHEVARAIRDVSRHPGVDVVIVARGGGSLEDLWAFNEEAVARAIAASPVPVVSGVGHEIDTTIADFAADVRAATPSNAAEIVVARRDELARRIAHLDHRARAAVRQRVAARPGRGARARHPPRAPDDPDARLEPRAPRRRAVGAAPADPGPPPPVGAAAARRAGRAPRRRRPAAPAGPPARPAGGRRGTAGAGRASPAPSRRAGVRLAGRPARRAQSAGGARPRLCRVLRGRRADRPAGRRIDPRR